MYYFKHEFRQLRPQDGYDGCMNLPNGDKPIICEVYTETDSVSVILSGADTNDSLITLITDDAEYLLPISKFNMVAILVADAIVGQLEEGKDNLPETVKDIVSDYGMI